MTHERKLLLDEKLPAAAIKERTQGNSQVSYIEGHHAIREANRIFDFDGWERFTDQMNMVQCEQGSDMRWKVAYVAKVRVVVDGVTREGYGFGNGLNKDAGAAHELAVKEAETDGMKRALMTFGDPFGLALYDKAQSNVSKGAAASNPDRKACFAILNKANVKYDDQGKVAVLAFLSSGQSEPFESATEVPPEVWEMKRSALDLWSKGQKKIAVLDTYVQAAAQVQE